MSSNTNRASGSIGLNGTLSNVVLQGLSAYEVAVKNGYEGTQAEWLESLKGETIELKQENGIVYWKYSKEEIWNELIDLSDKLDRYQGTDMSGMIMAVNEEGNIVPKQIENLQLVDEQNLDDMLQEVFK